MLFLLSNPDKPLFDDKKVNFVNQSKNIKKLVRTCYRTVPVKIRQIFPGCLIIDLPNEVLKQKKILMSHSFLKTLLMKKNYNIIYFAEIFECYVFIINLEQIQTLFWCFPCCL